MKEEAIDSSMRTNVPCGGERPPYYKPAAKAPLLLSLTHLYYSPYIHQNIYHPYFCYRHLRIFMFDRILQRFCDTSQETAQNG